MELTRRGFLSLTAASAFCLLCTGCGDAAAVSPAGTLTAHTGDAGLSYWLYTPQSTGTPKTLVLYLHGGSGKGSDLNTVLEAESLPRFLQEGQLAPDAYVVMPQLPANCKGWSDCTAQLMQLLAVIKAQYPIARTVLTGHSMGGTGCWDLAVAHPETFCAAAPLSGSVRLTEQSLTALQSLPVWAVVGSADTIVKPDASEQFITALQEKNPNAQLTVREGATHFDVPQTYLDDTLGLLDWLTAAR